MLGLVLELRATAVFRAVTASGDHQRSRAIAVVQAEVQRREPAHRDADHVRLVDPESVEHGADVVAGARLRIVRDLGGNVGGRIAARVVGDASVAPREMAHLRLVAAMVAGELVDEDDRQALAGLFVVELHAIVSGHVRHRDIS